jgi:excisionase family DNA binding protein
MAEPLMTVRDLAEYLGCGRDLAYALVASASIPSIRLGPGGRAIRLRPDSVAAWLRAQEGKGPENNGADAGGIPATAPDRRALHAQRSSPQS